MIELNKLYVIIIIIFVVLSSIGFFLLSKNTGDSYIDYTYVRNVTADVDSIVIDFNKKSVGTGFSNDQNIGGTIYDFDISSSFKNLKFNISDLKSADLKSLLIEKRGKIGIISWTFYDEQENEVISFYQNQKDGDYLLNDDELVFNSESNGIDGINYESFKSEGISFVDSNGNGEYCGNDIILTSGSTSFSTGDEISNIVKITSDFPQLDKISYVTISITVLEKGAPQGYYVIINIPKEKIKFS